MTFRRVLHNTLYIALAAAMLLGLVAMPGTAAANEAPFVALSEDFQTEKYPDNDDGQRYDIQYNTGSNALGGQILTVAGSQVLALRCSNQTGGRSNLFTLSEKVQGSVLKVEFDWNVGQPASAQNAGGFTFRNDYEQNIFTLLVQNTSASANRFRYFTGDFLLGAVPTGAALNQITALNTWYSISVTFDFNDKLIDLTVRNRANPGTTQTVTGIPFDDTQDFHPNLAMMAITGFRMSGQNITWNTDFDNFVFTVIDATLPVIPVESVSISGRSKVEAGGRILLYPNVSPTTATNKEVVWSSSDPEIAAVDPVSGIVTGISDGEAVISATADGVTATFAVTVGPLNLPARQVEYLDRGLVAVPAQNNEGILIAWRMFGLDPQDVAFNLYRDGVMINYAPIADVTNFIDTSGTLESTYQVSAIIDGREGPRSKTAVVWENGYLPIPIQKPPVLPMVNGGTNYDYFFEDATVADLDGDGEYEIIGRWSPTNLQDNSVNGYTGPMYIDAYKLDGTLMWRVSLGTNIRAGQHYAPMMVYDFDGDGRAEMIMRTSDRTVDGAGNVIGDPNRNWVNNSGHIMDGAPEYLTVFCGLTGEVLNGYIDEADGFLKTDLYVPQRGRSQDWGDNAMNRSDRLMGGVAYLDGVRPSAIFTRGYYTRSTLTAWDWDGESLTMRWAFDSNTWGPQYEGQGNHSLSVADVDGDGFDEIIYGAMTIDHDGTPLYNSILGHGDALHVGDFDPDRPGLEIFSTFETPQPWGYALRDAQTGDIIWATSISGDTDQGMAAHIDPRRPGMQFWTDVVERVASNRENFGVYDISGEKYSLTHPVSANFAVWWTGDLMRELLDRDRTNDNIGSSTNPNSGVRLDKWDWVTGTTVNLMMMNDVRTNDAHKATPVVTGDIVGDWRENFVLRTADSSELRLYTTNYWTEHRFYTLMHDTQYRVAVAWQNTTYNMPPHPSFYIGTGMDAPPDARVFYASEPEEIVVTSLRIVDDAGVPLPAMVAIPRNGTISLYAAVNPGAPDDGIEWSVNNTALATVTDGGVVTIRGTQGNVIVTAKAPGGLITHSVVLRIT